MGEYDEERRNHLNHCHWPDRSYCNKHFT